MDHQPNKGSGSTFGRGLMKYVASKLPYNSIPGALEGLEELNPKYNLFYKAGTKRDEALVKHSVSQTNMSIDEIGAIGADSNYSHYLYAHVDPDKYKRLTDYRVMAAYAEVADALDEICDDMINTDENDVVAGVKFKAETSLSNTAQDEIQKEFQKLVTYFDLPNKGWDYFRQLLVEGEVYWEHIIHKEHAEAGILGILEVPGELIDPIYDNVQNLMIKGYLLRRPIMDPKTNQIEKFEYIPFDKNQITYTHSGVWNEDKTMRLPFIENARRSYRQLTMMEDAVVIHRLVRAPERLVFNVDVGNMPPPKAEAYLRKLMHNYFNRKTYDHAQGGNVNAFNPQSMLDSFWFAKRQGSEGTQVDSMQHGPSLTDLDDLLYFVKKLYKSLKVPTGRLDPESTYSSDTSVLREELKFAKFIMRLQQKFAEGLKNTFVTHLKLKKLWKHFNLKEKDFDVKFVPPGSFHTLREQQIFDVKSTNYSNMAQNELVSSTYAQKKYLGWSDADILENRAWLKKDKAMSFELANIESGGPNWREGMQAGAEGGAAPMGGDMGGGSALPPPGPAPDFGGPVDVPPPADGGVEPVPADMGGDSALPPA